MENKFIHHAAKQGNLVGIKTHIELYGVCPNLITKTSKETALILAVKGHHLDIVQYLLRGKHNLHKIHKCRPEDQFHVNVKHKDWQGRNALHYAMGADGYKKDNTTFTSEIIDELMSRGANPFDQDEDGITPVSRAVRCGNITALKTIDKYDFKETMDDLLFSFCEVPVIRDSKIYHDTIEYLVQKGASVNSYKPETEIYLIDIAVLSKDPELVKTLIHFGASADRAYQTALDENNHDMADMLEKILTDKINDDIALDEDYGDFEDEEDTEIKTENVGAKRKDCIIC